MRRTSHWVTLSAAAGTAAVVLAVNLAQPALLAQGEERTHTPASSASSPRSATAPATTPATAPLDVRPGRPFVRVQGAVQHQGLRLARADLAALPQHTVTTTYTANGVPVTATFTGPLLIDVLDAAQPRFDPSVKNDPLRFAVRATAHDGYQAVVAWGEIDPGFEGKQVLLALTQDGADLTRPRLVVPGDARGGRYVSDVVALRLFDLGG